MVKSSETVRIPIITDNYSKMLYKCIEPLIKDYENHQATSLYYSIPESVKYTINWSYLFKLIGSRIDWSATILDRCFNVSHSPTPTVYMLFIYARSHEDMIRSVGHQLKYISCNEIVWKPEVYTVVIVILAFQEDPQLIAREIIYYLWKIYVFDCNVIIITEDGKYGEIYGANPFHKLNRCGHQLTVIKKLYNCLDPEYSSETAPVLHIPNIFPNCSLRVSMNMQAPFAYLDPVYGVDGTDIMLVKLIEEKFGVKSMISVREKLVTDQQLSTQFNNRFWRMYDIALGGHPMMQDFLNTVVYCRINVEHRYYFYLSDVADISGWQILIRVFLPAVWYSLGVIIFASIIILHLIKFRMRRKTRKLFTPFLLIIGFILQQSRKIPNDNVLRLYLFTIIPLFYLIGSLYTSLLHSFTLNPPAGRRMSSLDELYRWNMSSFISPENLFILRHIINASIQAKKWKVYSDINEAVIDITENDITLLETNLLVRYVLSKHPYDIYRLNDLVCNLNVALVLPKGSLFESKIDGLIKRINENGLYSRWLRFYTTNEHRKHQSVVNTRDKISNVAEVLTLTSLTPVFVLLIIGYALSFIVFIFELIYKINVDKK
ncbi:hypothetical protein O3M35_007196 [Rhynocoris fuscipes]|uniref:Ionotropic receptor n=1 Tax=Rhynocoris fuscipes TaxID=488301 RepID=A0AAW1D9C3_9HEMI